MESLTTASQCIEAGSFTGFRCATSGLRFNSIRGMTIAPGIFDTPMLQGMSNEILASLGAQIPFPSRLGRPDKYVALAKHIIETEVLNGEVIRLDGAIRMGAK